MKIMKKIFLFSAFFMLTAVSPAQSETDYHLETIANQLRYSRIPYDDCYVSSVVSKDPVEFAKKIQEYTAVIYYYINK